MMRQRSPKDNATTVPDRPSKKMKGSLVIAQEIGREMKLEAADALLAVSSEPREGKSKLEIDTVDQVVRSSCCDESSKNIVKNEPVHGETVQSEVIREENARTPATISPNHNTQRSALPRNSTERTSRTPTTAFLQPYVDHMHPMNQRSFSHPGIAVHQFPSNFPYGASYPLPYNHRPWHSEVRFNPLDQQRSRHRCTPKMQPVLPRVWR